MLKLKFKNNKRPEIWLVPPSLKIGKDSQCDIVINEEGVDNIHAELLIKDNDVFLKHIASTKCTYVNDMVALEEVLKPEDILRIGHTEMMVYDPLEKRQTQAEESHHPTTIRPAISDWLLKAETQPFTGRLFPIGNVFTIGRDMGCDVTLPVQHVSRKHAQLFMRDNLLFVSDYDSANGTFVNGKRIKEIQLRADDEIKIDQFAFKVVFVGEAAEPEPFQTSIRSIEELDKTVIAKASDIPVKENPQNKNEKKEKRIEVFPGYLHGMSGAIKGKVFELKETGNAVGRMLGHHLSRDDSSVSARHVEIYREGRHWFIKNNGASNGLLVNGRMTAMIRLVDGDEITIGGYELQFQGLGAKPKQLRSYEVKTSRLMDWMLTSVIIFLIVIVAFFALVN